MVSLLLGKSPGEGLRCVNRTDALESRAWESEFRLDHVSIGLGFRVQYHKVKLSQVEKDNGSNTKGLKLPNPKP